MIPLYDAWMDGPGQTTVLALMIRFPARSPQAALPRWNASWKGAKWWQVSLRALLDDNNALTSPPGQGTAVRSPRLTVRQTDRPFGELLRASFSTLASRVRSRWDCLSAHQFGALGDGPSASWIDLCCPDR